ncbi:alpha/beta hydrolase [Gemmobacter denitrificans]|uniref:Alpha/beta fold hydrolase n=1 Tax=Gemmobacter denitrificans TaxID=3123040 RepID=A0ABU8BTN2_9RHOB
MTARSPWPLRLLVGALVLAGLSVLGSTWFAHRLMVSVLTATAFASAEGPAPGNAPSDPLAIGYRGTPEQAFGLAFEEVSVATPLGPAPAWLVPAKPGPVGESGRAAIYLHGIGGAREDGYPYLPALHEAGLPVLMMTYRHDAGAPPAPGGLRQMGLTEWEDLEAAVALMQARGHDRIVLVGASMGGGIVGQFLARSPRATAVEALVLDAPALDFPMVMRHVTDRLGLPLRSIGVRLAVPAFAISHGVNMAEARSIAAVAAFDGPVLLIHGAADRVVPDRISLAVLAARQGQTTVLRTSADHLQSHRTAPEKFDRVLRDFLASLPR